MDDPAWQLNASVLIAQSHLRNGNAELARDAFQQALEAAHVTGDKDAVEKVSTALAEVEVVMAEQLLQPAPRCDLYSTEEPLLDLDEVERQLNEIDASPRVDSLIAAERAIACRKPVPPILLKKSDITANDEMMMEEVLETARTREISKVQRDDNKDLHLQEDEILRSVALQDAGQNSSQSIDNKKASNTVAKTSTSKIHSSSAVVAQSQIAPLSDILDKTETNAKNRASETSIDSKDSVISSHSSQSSRTTNSDSSGSGSTYVNSTATSTTLASLNSDEDEDFQWDAPSHPALATLSNPTRKELTHLSDELFGRRPSLGNSLPHKEPKLHFISGS